MKHVTRREMLKRGAVTGAAIAWATPVIQTVSMSKAFAQAASGAVVDTDISYIALNVACNGNLYFIKYEVGSGWEDDPGNAPFCDGLITPYADGADGGSLGFGAVHNNDGTISITVPAGCDVVDSVSKAGLNCCGGGTGGGTLTYACSN